MFGGKYLLIGMTGLSWACAQPDLFTTTGEEIIPPDRLTLQGTLCTEDTSGSDFPVKVLFMVDSSLRAFSADPAPNQRLTAINDLVLQNRVAPNVTFSFANVGSVSQSIAPVNPATCQPPPCDPEQFFRPNQIDPALLTAALVVPAGNQRDLVAAINQAESVITSDIANSSPGEILRSRYLVYLLVTGPPDPVLTTTEISDQVSRLRNFALGRGALEFRFDVGFLYYGPRTIDQGSSGNHQCYPAGGAADPLCPCSMTVTGSTQYCDVFCAVDSGSITEQQNQDARLAYNTLAFAGNGVMTEFPCPSDIDPRIGINTSQLNLVRKDIVAYNSNARLTPDGPLADSDGDGLTDEEELAAATPTDPTLRDTDGDGLGDRIEFRTFPRQDPLDPTDRPLACFNPGPTGVFPDQDRDLLNDCEEGLLSTSPTIPDTDGDGLPDSLEFFGGTIPTSADDRLLDFDADGIPNAEEILAHTDPRTNDAILRGAEAYRSELSDRGVEAVAAMEDTSELRAVTFVQATTPVVGGPALMRWDGCAQTLEWSDARWQIAPPYNPVPTIIDGSGRYELAAESANGDRIAIEVDIVSELLPTCGSIVTTNPRLTVTNRQCYDVQISNIKLVETQPANGDTRDGINRVLVFFTQAPLDRLTSPGISRVAEIPVRFQCQNPNQLNTCTRNPENGIVVLTDSQFVAALP